MKSLSKTFLRKCDSVHVANSLEYLALDYVRFVYLKRIPFFGKSGTGFMWLETSCNLDCFWSAIVRYVGPNGPSHPAAVRLTHTLLSKVL